MSEYITPDGKINDIETVRAQAEQNPNNQGCACACSQDLSQYVLSSDFVNALQNIKQMIEDAITNYNNTTLRQWIINKIIAALKDVWKHIGLIDGTEHGGLPWCKEQLERMPKVQGNTKAVFSVLVM